LEIGVSDRTSSMDSTYRVGGGFLHGLNFILIVSILGGVDSLNFEEDRGNGR
jgi:hypothetical protein